MISSSFFFFSLDKCSLFLQVQGFCFGFIEFELLNSMHSAIEVWNLALATAFTVQCSFLFTIVFVNSYIKKQAFLIVIVAAFLFDDQDALKSQRH